MQLIKVKFYDIQKNTIMKNLKTTHVFKTLLLIAIMGFTIGNAMAQVRSITVRMNYLPVIVPKAPDTVPNIYNVCQHVPLNLKSLYVSEVDTNGTALADTNYTLVFSTQPNFSSLITGPNYTFTLPDGNSQTIYAKVTMNNSLACENDTFSFVLNAKPLPVFTTQNLTACYGIKIDLTNAVQSLTSGGVNPLIEFSTDSANFAAIANPASYDATILGGVNGGNYMHYARVANTDPNIGCYSSILPFNVHIDTMPTLTLTTVATSGTAEICDGTTINLESFISSVSPATGTTLEFSISDTAFTSPLSGTAATAYVLTQNNTAQSPLTIYVRAKMNSTNCVGVNAGVQNFTLLINPMPKLVLTATANGDSVCDATTINLENYISSYTSGATLQFSSNVNFTDTIEGAAATAYALNLGNTSTQDRQFFVRAVLAASGCITVTDSVKNFTIKINPAPTTQTITSSLPANGCSSNIIAYSIPSQAGVTYQWSFTGGTLQGSGIGTADSVLWGAANPTALAQVVYALTTGTKACSRTATQNVDVKQSPTDVNLAIVAGTTEFCDNGTQQVQLRIDVTSGTPNFIVYYSWSPDSGTSSVTTTGTSALFNITLPNKGVDYTYTVDKVIDANGCQLEMLIP